MLRELMEIAAGLPSSKCLESGLPYERAFLPERPVPYRALPRRLIEPFTSSAFFGRAAFS